jgi:putative transposase
MPRQPRLELPGIPLHVTQRGVNRCAIFVDDDDRHHYRRLLREASQKYAVSVHAFVLMDNHVHLLLTSTQPGDLSRAMREVGQNYVQAFNTRHGRSGTLWQGRFKSCLVDSDHYVLTVIRYIELNPIRAAMVTKPEDYRWSSVHTHLGAADDPLITLHPLYLALGSQAVERQQTYERWLRAGISDEDITAIRQHLAQERVLGHERFQRMIEKTFNRPVSCRPRGRPRKVETEVS